MNWNFDSLLVLRWFSERRWFRWNSKLQLWFRRSVRRTKSREIWCLLLKFLPAGYFKKFPKSPAPVAPVAPAADSPSVLCNLAPAPAAPCTRKGRGTESNVRNAIWSSDRRDLWAVTWPWCIREIRRKLWNVRNAIGTTNIRKLWKFTWKKNIRTMTSIACIVWRKVHIRVWPEAKLILVATSLTIAKFANIQRQPKVSNFSKFFAFLGSWNHFLENIFFILIHLYC